MLTGENGILTQAQNAKEETEEARIEEENRISDYEDYINNVVEDVPQVNDNAPGALEGNGTEQDPYTINSIEDLVVFADNVTKGKSTYQNQYVELGLSLDFNSDKSYVNPDREDYVEYGYSGKLKETLNTSGFISIGLQEGLISEMEEKSFNGDFNGNGCFINNLKINQEKKLEGNNSMLIGLFASNGGNISGLVIKNATIIANTEGEQFQSDGILVGRNIGVIENCATTGNIRITNKAPIGSTSGINVGGIVGANADGKTKECYNKANIIVNCSSYDNRVGGIAGVNSKTASIENVYNNGEILLEMLDEQDEETRIAHIGGIIGYNVGKIENAYSTGIVSSRNDVNTTIVIGGTVGLNNQISEADKCYYLENIIDSSGVNTTISNIGEEKSSSQMKGQDFLNLLNQGNSAIWKFSSNKNNGYPVLYWE